MNLKEIKEGADIVSVVGKYVQLKQRGREWVGLCPFHNDSKPSMGVVPDKHLFKCLACGEGGDVIDFVEKIEGCTTVEAAKIVAEISGNAPVEQAAPTEKPTWRWLTTADDVPPPPAEHYQLKQPTTIYHYSDTFKVYRFDLADGGKEIRPLTYCESDGKQRWKWRGITEGRPLYNAGRIAAAKQVIVVEGEKCVDYLQPLLPASIAVVSWHGGVNAVDKTDWSPIAGKDTIYWPDNDPQGRLAMVHVMTMTGNEGKFIAAPEKAPKGWDVADSGWDAATAKGWVKANKVDPPKAVKVPEWASGETAYHDGDYYLIGPPFRLTQEPKLAAPEKPKPEPKPPKESGYFDPLGYAKGDSGIEFFFYVHASKMVHSMNSSKMTQKELLTMAPPDYWYALYPARSGFDINPAAHDLMQQCYREGIYDAEMIRGRGAWRDGDTFVVHAGDKLIVGGKEVAIGEHRSKFIYEVSRPMNLHTGKPNTADQGRVFIEMMKSLNWERGVNAHLLAGWCVVAPVCGALTWRPHVWITGGAGTGKTWIFREIISKLMGRAALPVEGSTSEAGVRQHLGNDAIPVIFDEAEAEDKASIERIETILNLMRISSAESDAKMLKGTAGHQARSFSMRSCFLFASIIYQARKIADRTRITVLGLKRRDEDRDEHFERVKSLYVQAMTPQFIEGFHARTLGMLPQLIAAIEVFAKVASKELGGQRLADQVAPLLAGAWVLCSDLPPTAAQAEKFMRSQDWSEEMHLDEERDEVQCLNYILETQLEIEHEHGRVRRTIGEMLEKCIKGGAGHTVYDISDRLLRCGIKVEGSTYTISNTSKEVRQILRGTQWEKNYAKVLQRVDGAIRTDTKYFSGGHHARGVSLKWKV